MTNFAQAWNASFEAVPADTDLISQGAGVIRDYKIDLRQRLAVDHSWADGLSINSNDGKHNQVTLRVAAAKPTLDATDGGVYVKVVSGKTELFYEDSSAAEIQITSNGAVDVPTFNPSGLPVKALPISKDGTVIIDSATGNASKQSLLADVFAMFQGFLGGFICSNNGTTQINVTKGSCVDDTQAIFMQVAAGTINFGVNGLNGLDTGAIAAGTTYHLFAISKTDGTTGLLASASLSGPTFPAGYTLKRRIASLRTNTGSAQFPSFVQEGDHFQLVNSVQDFNSVPPDTNGHLTGLTVPTAIKVIAEFDATHTLASSTDFLFTSPDQADVAASTTVKSLGGSGGLGVSNAGSYKIVTNVSGQIRYRVDVVSEGLIINTTGWMDFLRKGV